jgi:2-keto-4-pentenoate hydratase/2-oxohepta-3-ene-1,7-dioic acid hydratase in catechol pathway
MKFVRFGEKNKENYGLIDKEGNIRKLFNDLDGNLQKISLQDLLDISMAVNISSLPIMNKKERIGPCVANVGKIICVGLNYIDHIKETNSQTPKEPVIFSKLCAPTGANDDVILPKNSLSTDWEVELGVVIGKKTHYVSQEKAQNHIFGYCVINDLSERSFQLERSGQWVKGKSCQGFAPIGPWLVTKDEVPNIQNLNLWLEVNNYRYQDSNTKNMLFGVDYLVSYISQFMVLNAGDIISTGTPPGVGLGVLPSPIYLKNGDKVKVGIEGLGMQQQKVVAYNINNND